MSIQEELGRENWRILLTDDTPAIHEDIKKILLRKGRGQDQAELKALENALFAPAAGAPQATDATGAVETPYEIDSAFQGQEALALVEASVAQKRPYALAFMDMRMPPGWDGLETIERIWKVDPNIQIVICSAYSDYSWENILSRLGTTDRLLFLKKPFEPVEVQQMALALVRKWNLSLRNKAHIENLEELVEERTAEVKTAMERARMQGERAISEAVQKNLFPPRKLETPRLTFVSHYQYASMCGGDWLGLYEVRGKVALMIGDATGHGLDSAFLAVAARSCFAGIQRMAQSREEFLFSPSTILAYANRSLHEISHGATCMTFFAGVLDFDRGELLYANAGHNPPWLFRKKAEGDYELQSLFGEGPVLGEQSEATAFEEKRVPVSPGDLLFLYTDGLIESRGASREPFGKRRLRKVAEGCLDEGPEAVIQTVWEDFSVHLGKNGVEDDVTLAAALIR